MNRSVGTPSTGSARIAVQSFNAPSRCSAFRFMERGIVASNWTVSPSPFPDFLPLRYCPVPFVAPFWTDLLLLAPPLLVPY